MNTPICRPKTIADPRWKTRYDAAELELGWTYAGTGIGLSKYVWKNSKFQGKPERDGISAPYDYGLDKSGVAAPGSVRWIGKYYPGQYLGKGITFQIAVRVGGGYGRLLINDQLIAGVETEDWARKHDLAHLDPRLWALKGNVVYAGEDLLYLEMLSDPIDLEPNTMATIVLEYAIKEGPNLFGCKNFKRHVGRDHGSENDYDWMEVISEDLCYPDHFMVHPKRIKPGEKTTLSWYHSGDTPVLIDGVEAESVGQRTVSPQETTIYRYTTNGTTEEQVVAVLGNSRGQP